MLWVVTVGEPVGACRGGGSEAHRVPKPPTAGQGRKRLLPERPRRTTVTCAVDDWPVTAQLCITQPPSMLMVWPVMFFAWSDAR